jgi:hypothetical protein
MIAVDAWIEQSSDNGKTWARDVETSDEPEVQARAAARGHGPWSVPHAVEIARAIHAELVEAPWRFMVRVVDTDGVVVEQWPK